MLAMHQARDNQQHRDHQACPARKLVKLVLLTLQSDQYLFVEAQEIEEDGEHLQPRTLGYAGTSRGHSTIFSMCSVEKNSASDHGKHSCNEVGRHMRIVTRPCRIMRTASRHSSEVLCLVQPSTRAAACRSLFPVILVAVNVFRVVAVARKTFQRSGNAPLIAYLVMWRKRLCAEVCY